MSDTVRIEALCKTWASTSANRKFFQDILEVIDAADRAAGYLRIRADDATVEKVAKVIHGSEGYDEAILWSSLGERAKSFYRALARSVLEALATP